MVGAGVHEGETVKRQGINARVGSFEKITKMLSLQLARLAAGGSAVER